MSIIPSSGSNLQAILDRLDKVKRENNGQYKALCPAHENEQNTPSLSITEEDGKILLNCFGGCETEHVVKAMGLEMQDLFPDNGQFRGEKLTVHKIARQKKIPVKTLFKDYGLEQFYEGIKIPYYRKDGKPASRFRIRNPKWSKYPNRSWGGPKGNDDILCYGIWRLDEFAEKYGYLVLVEGESDIWTLWLYDIPAIGIPGNKLHKKLKDAYLAGMEKVYIWQEHEDGGKAFVKNILGRLQGLQYEGQVYIIRDAEFDDPNEIHCSSVEFSERWEKIMGQAVKAEIRLEDLPSEDTDLPRISAGHKNLSYQREASWDAIRDMNQKEPTLFVRSGLLTRVVTDENGRAKLEQVDADSMRSILDRSAYWYRLTKSEGEKPEYPPMAVVKDMLVESPAPVPPIRKVIQTPAFSSEGVLITEPGYHPDSQLWYTGKLRISDVPENPTVDEMRRARDFILDNVLVDFPFVADSDRAKAMSVLLLPFVRDMITGPTPLHIVDAVSGPGTGKSLLVHALAEISIGQPPAMMTEAESDAEWRKRITAQLMTGPRAILIDNVKNTLRSGALSSALTTKEFQDRVLGHSEIINCPVECLWVATGNKVRTSDEVTRRIIKCNLDAKISRPYLRDRSEFKHPNLLTFIRKNKKKLFRACLTLVQFWIAEGKPEGEKTIGMYEEWSQKMAGLLKSVGINGLLSDIELMYEEADVDTRIWEEFVREWFDRFQFQEVTAGQLYGSIISGSSLLPGVLGDGSERSQKTKLGIELNDKVGRQFGCYLIEECGSDHSGIKSYKLSLRA